MTASSILKRQLKENIALINAYEFEINDREKKTKENNIQIHTCELKIKNLKRENTKIENAIGLIEEKLENENTQG